MISKRAATIRGLERLGFSRDADARTSRYLVYRHPAGGDAFFVGKSGALRRGETASRSRSLTAKKDHDAIAFVGWCEGFTANFQFFGAFFERRGLLFHQFLGATSCESLSTSPTKT